MLRVLKHLEHRQSILFVNIISKMSSRSVKNLERGCNYTFVAVHSIVKKIFTKNKNRLVSQIVPNAGGGGDGMRW